MYVSYLTISQSPTTVLSWIDRKMDWVSASEVRLLIHNAAHVGATGRFLDADLGDRGGFEATNGAIFGVPRKDV